MRDPDTITTAANCHVENHRGALLLGQNQILYKQMPFPNHSRSFILLLRICVQQSAMFML